MEKKCLKDRLVSPKWHYRKLWNNNKTNKTNNTLSVFGVGQLGRKADRRGQ